MDQRQLALLNVGPHSRAVQAALQTISGTPLLQFRGVLPPQYQRVSSFVEAVRISREVHNDGLDWLELRDREGVFACGGGAYREKEPWRSLRRSIDRVWEIADEIVCQNIPKSFNTLVDDAFGDIISCLDWMI